VEGFKNRLCFRAQVNLRLATAAVCIIFVAVVLTTALAGTASAPLGMCIYRDIFSGTAGHILTGTKPGVDTTGASWIYNGNGKPRGDDWRADGAAPAKSGFGTLDYLPLHVKPGRIYNLSCVLSPRPGVTGRWFALGFFDHTRFDNSKTEGPWMTLADTAGWATFSGAIGFPHNHISHSLSHSVPLGKTARIILNTTGAHWTVRWLYNGKLLGGHTYATNPSKIGGVGIAVYNGQQGTVGDFELSVSPVKRSRRK